MSRKVSAISEEDIMMNTTKYAQAGVYDEDGKTYLKGKKNPYQRARSAGRSKKVSKLNYIAKHSLFDTDDLGQPPFSEKEMTMEQVHARRTEKSPTCISLFTGGGGMLTGFAMSGWKDVAISEFVNEACETIALNYNVHIIKPFEVKKFGVIAAEELGLEVLPPASREIRKVSDIMKLPPAVETDKNCKFRGTLIKGGINWENTSYRLDDEVFEKLRERTNELLYESMTFEPEKAYLWGDDIRGMSGTQLIKFLGLERGDVDCIEGGPPCASFSMAGRREKGWGHQSKYSEERSQSTRNLFDEYIRIVDEVSPKMFVAENVPSLTSGEEPRKYANDIINALESKGYRCEARKLLASNYECVQRRERLFIQGVRSDLHYKKTGEPTKPSWPVPSSNSYVLRDALEVCKDRNTKEMLEWADLKDTEIGRTWDVLDIGEAPENKQYMAMRCHPEEHCPTITVVGARDISGAGAMHPYERRKFTVAELMAIFGYPIDYQFSGDITQKNERMARSVPPILGKFISAAMRKNLKRSEVR